MNYLIKNEKSSAGKSLVAAMIASVLPDEQIKLELKEIDDHKIKFENLNAEKEEK